MYFDTYRAYYKHNRSNRFYLISKAELTKEFLQSKNFSNFTGDELTQILSYTVTQTMNMIQFSFKRYLFSQYNVAVENFDFFKKQEVLKGHSLADLFVKDIKIMTKHAQAI
jgi:hypothetical protein